MYLFKDLRASETMYLFVDNYTYGSSRRHNTFKFHFAKKNRFRLEHLSNGHVRYLLSLYAHSRHNSEITLSLTRPPGRPILL